MIPKSNRGLCGWATGLDLPLKVNLATTLLWEREEPGGKGRTDQDSRVTEWETHR